MRRYIQNILSAGFIQPKRLAISGPGGKLTYYQFGRVLWAFAVRMRAAGIDKSSCVAIRTNQPLMGLCAILAVAMVGARWVQANSALREKKGIAVTHFLFTAATDANFMPGTPALLIDERWFRFDPPQAVSLAPSIVGPENDSDIWMIAQSSGSTGTPKFIELSYANYDLRNDKTSLTHDFRPVITGSLFPVLSAPWVSYNLRTLKLLGTLVLGHDPVFLVQNNVQKLFGSPKQFDLFLERPAPADIPRIPIAHVAGATLSPGFAKRIFERFITIHNFYGSTEVGGVARNVLTTPPDDMRCIGTILSGNNIAILGENGRALPESLEGRLAIRNNVMVGGYLDEPEATQQAFRNGWFLPGDLAFYRDGQLYLTGRVGDVINVAGSKVNVSALEALVASYPGVREAAAHLNETPDRPPELMLLVVLDQGVKPQDIIQPFWQMLKSSTVSKNLVKGVYFRDSLPRNANGKLVRGEIAGLVDALVAWRFDFADELDLSEAIVLN